MISTCPELPLDIWTLILSFGGPMLMLHTRHVREREWAASTRIQCAMRRAFKTAWRTGVQMSERVLVYHKSSGIHDWGNVVCIMQSSRHAHAPVDCVIVQSHRRPNHTYYLYNRSDVPATLSFRRLANTFKPSSLTNTS